MISNLIRLGQVNREEGMERLSQENVISDEFLRELFSEVGLSGENLIQYIDKRGSI